MPENILKDNNHTERKQMLAVHISIAGGIFIFLVSLIVGIIADSIALLLDASTGLVMVFSAFFVRVIIRKINKPPDHLFNFGYEKYEPLTVILQNALILMTCLIGIKYAVQDIIHAEDITRYDLPIISTFFATIIAFIIASYLKKIATITTSSVLRTASFHWHVDGTLSFGMCIGFTLGYILRHSGHETMAMYVDPVMTIILAVFFMVPPARAFTHNMNELLDAAPSKDIRVSIGEVIERYKPKYFGIHRTRFRKAGKKTFVDVCFVVHGDLTIKETEKLANDFEKDLVTQIPSCDVIVYFKPA